MITTTLGSLLWNAMKEKPLKPYQRFRAYKSFDLDHDGDVDFDDLAQVPRAIVEEGSSIIEVVGEVFDKIGESFSS